jgi:ATPase components of ABC transporters with duplicated ATPase domains
MLILKNISYTLPNKDLLFDNINLILNNRDKVALIGNNGTGKSTLLKIISGEITSFGGQMLPDATPYYIPQIFGQYNEMTVAQALLIDEKLKALKKILAGNVTNEALESLNDDWTIEERCIEALEYWQMKDLEISHGVKSRQISDVVNTEEIMNLKMGTLSGGQKAKVFLAGITIHKPAFVLLDEPSNHLDQACRQLLYDFIKNTSLTMLVISHDRTLLNLLDTVCELNKHGITVYGGNYDFYAEQKKTEKEALADDIKSKEKALRKAKEKERETVERQQKLDARGKKKQEKAGVARILMNSLKDKAENSTSKMKSVHSEKIGGITQELQELRSSIPDIDKMKFGLDNSVLHKGKIMFKADGVNFNYDNKRPLWQENLIFQISSGERIIIEGINGSGKTTLIKIILGHLKPNTGAVYIAENKSVYIDQDYSLIKNELTVYEQAQQYNDFALQEGEVKSRLNRFLFTKEDWDKQCAVLSGGERMRLMLCCLTINNQAPDIIILDEPTNNLDVQNIEILTAAINEYRGTLIVVSHDNIFCEQINISSVISLS